MLRKTTYIYGGAIGVLVIALGGVLYMLYHEHSEHVALESQLAQANVRTADLTDLVAKKEEQLDAHRELIRVFRRQSADTAYNFSSIRAMVAEATQTVADIKKLEEADEELLAKYSKVYFLNEHYTPEQLVSLSDEYIYGDRTLRVKAQVRPFLLDMLEAMQSAGLSPLAISAYRSFDYQKDLKHRHEVTYGARTANQFVADQGYSEHQLGTTVDIVNKEIGSRMAVFDKTSEYAWLRENAHHYGFVLSYPPDNAYYKFEPWHWRFVGVALATRLHEEGKHFYDLPQREINEYRVDMFEGGAE